MVCEWFIQQTWGNVWKIARKDGGLYIWFGFKNGDTYMHACMHTCIHASIHPYMHTCIHAYIHTCIHAYMHTCIHGYMHTWINACMHATIHTIHTIHYHTLPCITIHYHTLPYITIHYHTLPYIPYHTIPYQHTYIPTYIHTYQHTYIHTNIHTYIHIYICIIYTYILCVHVCIHLYVYIYTVYVWPIQLVGNFEQCSLHIPVNGMSIPIDGYLFGMCWGEPNNLGLPSWTQFPPKLFPAARPFKSFQALAGWADLSRLKGTKNLSWRYLAIDPYFCPLKGRQDMHR